MLTAIFFPFVLSSVYWILEVAQQIIRIEQKLMHPGRPNDDPRILNYYTSLFNAVILLNVRCSLIAFWALCLIKNTIVCIH